MRQLAEIPVSNIDAALTIPLRLNCESQSAFVELQWSRNA